MFPEPIELHLTCCSIESIWTPKIQIKCIDTKIQFADILTKKNFTRDDWDHLLTLFNISHFSSTACITAMTKRGQQKSREGRVTAKSRPMMNLTARTLSFVSSSALIKPGEDLAWMCQIIGSFMGSSSWTGVSAMTSPRTIDCPQPVYHTLPRSILMVLKFLAYNCHCP